MFGYIAPLKSELKMREFEVYNSYYCAICRAVKRRYGELPRLMLSYDAVLVAMLADALSGAPEGAPFRTFRCFNNPLKKRNEAASSAGIDYAADVMVLLGWLSLKDAKKDRDAGSPLKGLASFAGEAALRRAGRRAAARLGDKALAFGECIVAQQALESVKEGSLDRAADPTGHMMAEALDFTAVPEIVTAPTPELSQALRGIGYHIGRYIYIIDAADDLEKDRKHGSYNPLLLRPQTSEALKTAVSLDLARVGELTAGLPLQNHRDIVENIIYLGLHAKMDEVFERFGGTDGDAESEK